jgi:hypothetical protein
MTFLDELCSGHGRGSWFWEGRAGKITAVLVCVLSGADAIGDLHGPKAGYPTWPANDPKVMSVGLYFDTSPNRRARPDEKDGEEHRRAGHGAVLVEIAAEDAEVQAGQGFEPRRRDGDAAQHRLHRTLKFLSAGVGAVSTAMPVALSNWYFAVEARVVLRGSAAEMREVPSVTIDTPQ